MAKSATSTLIISDRGWANKRELRVANVSASWRVSGVGRLSAMITAREAWLLGVDDLLGMWVRWDHPTLGIWGGMIEDVRMQMGAGTLELSCSSFLSDLKHYRTRLSYQQVSAPAGSLVRRAFADLAVKVPFTSISADTDGDPVSITWRADKLSAVIDRLAKAGNKQYDAPLSDAWTIDFAFRRQVGQDRTGSIMLWEGRQIVDGPITASLADLTNDILAVSAVDSWDEATTAVAVNGSSRKARGPYQATIRYYGFNSAQALRSRARVDLQTMTTPAVPVVIRLSDRTPELSEIRDGDTIRMASSTANAYYAVDIAGRAVDAETGVVSLVGDAEVLT